MKLNTNYAPLRGVPGVVQPFESNLCRACGGERETPAHVLGACAHSNHLVTERQHRVKRKICSSLKKKGFVCYEEVYAIDSDARVRFCVIVAIDPVRKNGFVVDSTIRFELSRQQAGEIEAKKKSIYETCLPYLQNKYGSTYGELDWEVIGLLFGSRGMMPKFAVDFWKRFDLPTNVLIVLSQET